MVHILLMILKIIGIILLVILGIVLAVLLAVLFIPVRYRAVGAWHEELKLTLKVTWFLHLLSVRAYYAKDGLEFAVRILGIPLLKKHDKDAVQDAAQAVKEGAGELLGDSEQTLEDELLEDEARYRQAAEEKAAGGKRSGQKADVKEEAEADHAAKPEPVSGQPSNSEKDERIPQKDASPSFFGRIRHKLAAFLEKLKASFMNLRDKVKGTKEFVLNKKEWLENEKNQASLKLLFRQVKRLIAHVWPSKGKGSVTFGFDDPYTTGQVLQAVSLIYPFYHRQLTVTPVFGEAVLDAEGSFRGRIRLAYPLWLAFQVFIDKHTRRMIRGFIK